MFFTFNEWAKLMEMAWITMPVAFEGQNIHQLDMRFEDYDDSIKKELMMGKAYTAQIPGTNKYFVFDGKNLEIDTEPNQNAIQLPENWFEFVAGYDKNQKLIKKPLKMRQEDYYALPDQDPDFKSL